MANPPAMTSPHPPAPGVSGSPVVRGKSRSRSASGGDRARTRSKSVIERNGGSCSGRRRDVNSCNRNDCPGKVVFTNTITLYKYGNLKVNKIMEIII